MLTGRKYRLALSVEQIGYAERVGGISRAVWNTGLEQRREYRRRGRWIDYTEQAAQLVDAKRDHEWLRDAPSHTLQQTLKDLDKACSEHGTFRVRWRSARRWRTSLRFPDPKYFALERLSKRWARVKLPKFGWVRFRLTRALGGRVRSATVSRDGKHWNIAFLIDDGMDTARVHANGDAVGIDRGVKVAISCSDGTAWNRRFSHKGEEVRYRRLQQKLARQQKNSSGRRKTLAAMRSLRQRECFRRKDFVAWTANRLATRYAFVILERLRTRAMTASAKGTVAAPRSGAAQKRGLNRSILAKGWHQFEIALASAARYTGTRIVKVPAAYTSQTCSRCRSVDPESRKSQAWFRCTRCGHSENADLNAAKNILAAGLAVTACGDLGIGRSAKQEPAGSP